MKRNLQLNGLAMMAGQRASKALNATPAPNALAKYSKIGNRNSPYVNKAGQRNQSNSVMRSGNANTDSEIYNQPSIHARPGPTGIGQGSNNVGSTIRREKEMAVLKEVETQKKAVLEKLNKIQSKKFSAAN